MLHNCLFLALDMLTGGKGTHKFSNHQIFCKKKVLFLAIPHFYCTFAAILKNKSSLLPSELLDPVLPRIGSPASDRGVHPASAGGAAIVVPDAIHWYPMRVTYQRVKAIKALLDADQIENYLPMRWEWQETTDGQRRLRHLPVIASMIFVRDTRNRIIALKQLPGYEPMRFYTRPSVTVKNRREIFPIPDKQMEDFIRVASSNDERVVFLEDTDYLRAVGQRVRVAEGEFAGIEGVVKRIKSNKCVVVRLEGIATVAILRFPVHALIKI